MNCSNGSLSPDLPAGAYFHILSGVVDVIIIAVIIICNSLIIFAILRNRGRRKASGLLTSTGNLSVRFVLSLATSDILVALSTIYFLSFNYSCTVYTTLGSHKTPCLARFVFMMSAGAASTYCLIALAVDRYVAVVHALRYRVIMTNRVVNTLIILVWVLGATYGCSLIFWNHWTPTTPCIGFAFIPTNYISSLTVAINTTTVAILGFLHWRVHRATLASCERWALPPTNHLLRPPSYPARNIMACSTGCNSGAH